VILNSLVVGVVAYAGCVDPCPFDFFPLYLIRFIEKVGGKTQRIARCASFIDRRIKSDIILLTALYSSVPRLFLEFAKSPGMIEVVQMGFGRNDPASKVEQHK
jgi:hypothetical protein